MVSFFLMLNNSEIASLDGLSLFGKLYAYLIIFLGDFPHFPTLP